MTNNEIQVGDVFKNVHGDETFVVKYVGEFRAFGEKNGYELTVFKDDLNDPALWSKDRPEKHPEGVTGTPGDKLHFTDSYGDLFSLEKIENRIYVKTKTAITLDSVTIPAETFRWLADKILGD